MIQAHCVPNFMQGHLEEEITITGFIWIKYQLTTRGPPIGIESYVCALHGTADMPPELSTSR